MLGERRSQTKLMQLLLPESPSTTQRTLRYIYVRPSTELNIMETTVVGVRHGDTIEVETRYWTNIDTDNFGRLLGVEILAPGDIKNELRKQANG